MSVNGEGVPGTMSAEPPLRGLDAIAVIMATELLEENPDAAFAPDLPWELAQHLRRTFAEALHAKPVDNLEPKSIAELTKEARLEVKNAIAANDGSLNELIQASRLREEARLESQRIASLGFFARRRALKAGRAVLRTTAASSSLQPKSV